MNCEAKLILLYFYLFLTASMSENPVSHRYDVLKGIKNFKARSEISPYSALLLSQKWHKMSFLNSFFKPPSHESSTNWSLSWTEKSAGETTSENGFRIHSLSPNYSGKYKLKYKYKYKKYIIYIIK